MGSGIVLGRFQPFHNGHAHLVEQALNQFEEVTIAIGSSPASTANWSRP
ncbi:MAG: adenylyltransferase/cytidyltransferase family protein [Candidatus Poseidoniaceae archaeon]